MFGFSKLAVAAAVAATALATPALAQSFDPDAGTGNVLSFGFAPSAAAHDRVVAHDRSHRSIAARHSGAAAFALVAPPGVQANAASNDPALTGGGSLGYNQLLLQY